MKNSQKLGQIYLGLQKQASEIYEVIEAISDEEDIKSILMSNLYEVVGIAHNIHLQAYRLKDRENI